MKNKLSSLVVLFFLLFTTVLGSFSINVCAKEDKSGLVLDVDFDDMKVGEQTMAGVVEKYGKSNALKLNVGRNNTTLKFDSLVVGECAMSFDIAAMPKSIKGEMCVMSGAAPAYILQFTEDGKIVTGNGRVVSSYAEKMQTICIVFDTLKECFDVYVNDRLRGSRMIHSGGGADKVAHFSLTFAAVGESADVYLDNIHAYPTYVKTSKGKIYNPSAKPDMSKNIVLSDKTINPSDKPQRDMLKDAASIHMRSGVVFDGKEKIITASLPYYSGNEFMIPQEAAAHALKLAVDTDGEVIKVGDKLSFTVGSTQMVVGDKAIEIEVAPEVKDGRLYLPLKALANALGKKNKL